MNDSVQESVTRSPPPPPPPHSTSLLDGEFNADESHASFLEALKEWRKGAPSTTTTTTTTAAHPTSSTVAQSTTTHSSSSCKVRPTTTPSSSSSDGFMTGETDTAQQTPALQQKPLVWTFQNSLSYFDRLRIGKLLEDMSHTSGASLETPVVKRDTSKGEEGSEEEKNTSWDQEDEELFIEILQKMQSRPAVPEADVKPKEVSTQQEMDQMQQEMDQTQQEEKLNNDNVEWWCIEVEDVTDREDQVIMGLLDAGIMVECIPPSRLVVIQQD